MSEFTPNAQHESPPDMTEETLDDSDKSWRVIPGASTTFARAVGEAMGLDLRWATDLQVNASTDDLLKVTVTYVCRPDELAKLLGKDANCGASKFGQRLVTKDEWDAEEKLTEGRAKGLQSLVGMPLSLAIPMFLELIGFSDEQTSAIWLMRSAKEWEVALRVVPELAPIRFGNLKGEM